MLDFANRQIQNSDVRQSKGLKASDESKLPTSVERKQSSIWKSKNNQTDRVYLLELDELITGMRQSYISIFYAIVTDAKHQV